MTLSFHFFDIKIKKIINETSAIRTLILERPDGFNSLPGQFCWLTLPELRSGTDFPRTPMAIGSGVSEETLLFSFRNWGYLTAKFFDLQIGDNISVSQPLGTSLPLDQFNGSSILCIAGGTGIVPIRSFITSTVPNDRVKLFYGARTPSELLFKNELSHWNSSVIVERADENGSWSGSFGFVTKLLTDDLIQKFQFCYVCGPFPMMQNTISVLQRIGFQPDKIFVSIEKIENNEVIGPVFAVTNSNVVL